MVQIVTYKQNTEFSACFGTKLYFQAPMDMILRPVGSAFNFLPDFQGFTYRFNLNLCLFLEIRIIIFPKQEFRGFSGRRTPKIVKK